MTQQDVQAKAATAIQIVKVTAIVAVALLSLVGGYVVGNTDLRNYTIDYTQGQSPNE